MAKFSIDLTEEEARELLRAIEKQVHWACEWLEETPKHPRALHIIHSLLKVERALIEVFPDLEFD